MNETQKKKTLRWQLLTGAVVAFLLIGACIGWFYFTVSPIAEESGQRALLKQLSIDLAEYREQHGAFPSDLSAVHVSEFSDGASPAMLQQFRYTSDGSSFTLSCVGASTHRVVTITSDEIAATRRQQ